MGGIDFEDSYAGRFTELADDALRAGVVVNFLDISGLRLFLLITRNGLRGCPRDLMSTPLRREIAATSMPRASFHRAFFRLSIEAQRWPAMYLPIPAQHRPDGGR